MGERGGMNKALKTSATWFRKAFEWFLGRWPLLDLREQLPKM